VTSDRAGGEGDVAGDGLHVRRTPPADAVAFSQGSITRQDAMDRLRVRDYAGLLVLLGDHDLAPPRPSIREIEDQAVLFGRLWAAAGS